MGWCQHGWRPKCGKMHMSDDHGEPQLRQKVPKMESGIQNMLHFAITLLIRAEA
jgi:hypothetical protein